MDNTLLHTINCFLSSNNNECSLISCIDLIGKCAIASPHSSNRIFQFTEFNKMDRVISAIEKLCLLIHGFNCHKKVIYRIKLNMYMILSNLPDFRPLFNYFMIWLYCFLLHYHLCSEFGHTFYILFKIFAEVWANLVPRAVFKK